MSDISNNKNEINTKEIYNDFQDSHKINQINEKLNNSIKNQRIQDYFFQTGSSGDSTFDQFRNKERNELTEFFNNEKSDTLNFYESKINDFNSNTYNYNEIVKSILKTENGNNIYIQKIKYEINKIKNKSSKFQIKYLTVMLVGKSGVGKSTLINGLLKLSDKDKAETRAGNFVTTKIEAYQSKSVPFLRLVDTRGIELNVGFGAEEVKKETENYIKEQYKTFNPNNFVQCIWYCITGTRFEKAEIDLLNSLRNSYGEQQIPIIIVYTQAVDKNQILQMEKYIRDNNIDGKFLRVLAQKKILSNGKTLKENGLDILLKETLTKCRSALQGEMKVVMCKNISDKIVKKIKDDNSYIKKYIYEKSILDFISDYVSINKDKDFNNYCVNIFGNNIKYFLNEEMSKKSFETFNNSPIIQNNLDQYINDYREYAKNKIDPKLDEFAINFLDEQVKIQKEQKRSIQLQNKKRLNDLKEISNNFLNDNFYYLAQLKFIANFIMKQLEKLSKSFENNLNISTSKLINNKDLQDLIEKCYLVKFGEFEKKAFM